MFGDKKWYLFTILGNRVSMTLSFLIVALVFAGMGVQNLDQLLEGLLWVPVLFFGILLHELGHALTTRAFGYGNSEIVFWGMGGLAINRTKKPRSPKHNIVISLAGPAVSLTLALLSGAALFAMEGALTATSWPAKFLLLMAYANAFWAVFNMLPIYPMDGGQALSQGVLLVTRDLAKANRITGVLSIVTIGLTLLASAFVFRQTPSLFLIFLAAYFAYLNWRLIQSGQTQQWY